MPDTDLENQGKPDKEMLENLDLLIHFDLIKAEKEWSMIKILRKMQSMPSKPKEQDNEQ